MSAALPPTVKHAIAVGYMSTLLYLVLECYPGHKLRKSLVFKTNRIFYYNYALCFNSYNTAHKFHFRTFVRTFSFYSSTGHPAKFRKILSLFLFLFRAHLWQKITCWCCSSKTNWGCFFNISFRSYLGSTPRQIIVLLHFQQLFFPL